MKKIIFTLLGLLMMTNASAVECDYVPLFAKERNGLSIIIIQ